MLPEFLNKTADYRNENVAFCKTTRTYTTKRKRNNNKIRKTADSENFSEIRLKTVISFFSNWIWTGKNRKLFLHHDFSDPFCDDDTLPSAKFASTRRYFIFIFIFILSHASRRCYRFRQIALNNRRTGPGGRACGSRVGTWRAYRHAFPAHRNGGKWKPYFRGEFSRSGRHVRRHYCPKAAV